MSPDVRQALTEVLDNPSLATARALEEALRTAEHRALVFGRLNQKSSIDAASESDRGITERLANAFDASLTAARVTAGVESDPSLSPRNCAQRFLCPKRNACEWQPQHESITFKKPVLQFWEEPAGERHRYRKYNPGEGLATVLVRDFGLGIRRDDMPRTILALNTDDKLRTFEAIGQFGHGASSSLAFCESVLIITRPRFATEGDEFYWTLVYPEQETEVSKQALVRKWFAAEGNLPLVGRTTDFPQLVDVLPGTSVWHFGYNRGGWIKRIVGPEQSNPWGRLGRLFFSYPLPFEIHGRLARTDTDDGRRGIKGAFFRLLDQVGNRETIEHASSEKSESLMVEGLSYGSFSVFVFVMKERSAVRDYVQPDHPVLLTLNGQNHGELTRTLLVQANLPELASSSIVEVRLDGVEQEALGEIISNSRERPKNTVFTRAMQERLVAVLTNDEALAEIEKRRQEEKAQNSNADLNRRISQFLSSVLSEARAEPGPGGGSGAPGTSRGATQPLAEIPAHDPPTILQFLYDRPLSIPEGTTVLAKFKTDARPPKYSFHGDNPRCFAKLQVGNERYQERVAIVGKSDVNARGYGSVSITCKDVPSSPIGDEVPVGRLVVSIQSADGGVLQSELSLVLQPKPPTRERARRSDVTTEIIFCAPDGDPEGEIARLIAETEVKPFGAYLDKYRESLNLAADDCAYWGEASERGGVSVLQVEINAAHPHLKRLFQACRTAEERIEAKERYVRDVVLDCYQHAFRLEDVPNSVVEQVLTEPDDAKRAAEIYLNHDKALRVAIHEREASRRRAGPQS